MVTLEDFIFKMIKISILPLIAGLTLGMRLKGAEMEGGTALDDKRLYGFTVNLRKMIEGQGETKCLGIIFSAAVIFTSMLCEVTEADKNSWEIETVGMAQNASIDKVVDGQHKLDFRKLDLARPGLQLSEDRGDSKMPYVAPFNQYSNHEMSKKASAVVFTFGDTVKACTIKMLVDDQAECKKLYAAAVAENPGTLDPHPHLDVYCAVQGSDKMNLTLSQGNKAKNVVVDVGTPCDNSLGSPVFVDGTVYGMVVGAFCGNTKVALIQPSVTGLNLEGYTEEEPDTTKMTPHRSKGTSLTTGLKPSAKLKPPSTAVPRLANQCSCLTFSHVQVGSILILGALTVVRISCMPH